MHCKLNIKNIITQSSELLGLFEQMGKRPRVYYNHKVIYYIQYFPLCLHLKFPVNTLS